MLEIKFVFNTNLIPNNQMKEANTISYPFCADHHQIVPLLPLL